MANSGPIDYMEEMATDEDEEIIEEDQEVTAEDPVHYLAVKGPATCVANQDAGPINTLLTNDNNHGRDLRTEPNPIQED